MSPQSLTTKPAKKNGFILSFQILGFSIKVDIVLNSSRLFDLNKLKSLKSKFMYSWLKLESLTNESENMTSMKTVDFGESNHLFNLIFDHMTPLPSSHIG